ncbi:MAG: hypothetical protein L6R39_007789, partial [Caloplaca ligustica]
PVAQLSGAQNSSSSYVMTCGMGHVMSNILDIDILLSQLFAEAVMADLNYFVCTLGQAVEVNHKRPHSFKTINGFIDHQAHVVPDSLAVGFPVPTADRSDGEWDYQTFSFLQLRTLSLQFADAFHELLGPLDIQSRPDDPPVAVALLCSSSVEFLFTWLGLMRLGYSVLLVAYVLQTPWCLVTADSNIKDEVHNTCSVRFLIYDDIHATLAHSAANASKIGLGIFEIPKDLCSPARTQHGEVDARKSPDRTPSESDVAFYFHTSGTSTGFPKPIPQTHRGAIGVLPCLSDGHEKATFTTTPLYHGGIADCFRAWTSGALIWLFPAKNVPITTSNILRCIQCAKHAEASTNASPVKYFSSVPYVLQMVASEPDGMKMLQGKDIVGVGGAALPQDVGDSLAKNDVSLVSRFGSAECGFLLSSHRDYEVDREWQYLRSYGSDLLRFEEQQDGSGLSELVIQPQWPHMAKRNREDGSFATADLFVPHPVLKNAWKYHSRADSQLTLITGKKFDPAPLEAAIAVSDFLSDVLVFGNGRQSAGALLFRSDNAKEMNAEQLLDEVWPVVDKLNKEGQPHTRISRSMLVFMDPEAPNLEKSSKGTILRSQAEKKYAKEIESAYCQGKVQTNGTEGTLQTPVSEHEIPSAVLEIIKDVSGTKDRIPADADLFSYGVDSVACMAIRAKLQSRILDPGASQLPLNIVYDCGNIQKLSKYLQDLLQGRVTQAEDEIQLMKDLVSRYSVFPQPQDLFESSNGYSRGNTAASTPHGEVNGEHILLTGATGALGAHILHLLRSSPTTSQITCLVRAASPFAAHERVSKSLVARGKSGLPSFSPLDSSNPHSTLPAAKEKSAPRITCLPTTLSDPFLGLDKETYINLTTTTTCIIHAAWAVNFTARLRSFEKDHIAGLSHLLQLTLASSSCSSTSNNNRPPPRFLFLSSTAS